MSNDQDLIASGTGSPSGPRYATFRVGRVHWTAAADWRDLFADPSRDWARPEGVFDRARIISVDEFASTYVLEHFRRDRPEPVALRVRVACQRRWRDHFLIASHGRGTAIWRALLASEAAGIPCVRPVALGIRREGGLVTETILVTEHPAGAMTLEEALEAPDAARMVRDGGSAFARFVAALHEAGIRLNGYCPGALLVVMGDRTPRFHLGADSRASLTRGLLPGARVDDLVSLGAAFRGRSTRASRMRFFRSYVPGLALLEDHFRSYCGVIEERSARRLERVLRRRPRQWLGNNQSFRRVRTLRSTGHTVRLSAPLSTGFLGASGEATLAQPGATLVKSDETSTVWRQPLDLVDSRLTIFVKHYQRRKLLAPVWDLFRGSRARRGWCMSNGLLDRGLGAARPLAMMDRRWLFFPVESWLVTEEAAGALRLSEFAEHELAGFSPAIRRRLIRRLAEWVRRLHQSGCSARDLKPNNVLVRRKDDDFEIVVVDFDGMRMRGRVPDAIRARDVARLTVGLTAPAVHQSDRLRFLVHYLGPEGRSRDRRRQWWGLIGRWAQRRVFS